MKPRKDSTKQNPDEDLKKSSGGKAEEKQPKTELQKSKAAPEKDQPGAQVATSKSSIQGSNKSGGETQVSKEVEAYLPISDAKDAANLPRSTIVQYLNQLSENATSGSSFALTALKKMGFIAELLNVPTLKIFADETSNTIMRAKEKDKKARKKEKEEKTSSSKTAPSKDNDPTPAEKSTTVSSPPSTEVSTLQDAKSVSTDEELSRTLAADDKDEKLTKAEKKLEKKKTKEEFEIPGAETEGVSPEDILGIQINTFQSYLELDEMMAEARKRFEAIQSQDLPDDMKKEQKKAAKLIRMPTLRFKPIPVKTDFLRIHDLIDKYEVTYHNEYDDVFASAIKSIFEYKVVGIDGEYRMGKMDKRIENLPTYMQIATPKGGHVFNIDKLGKDKKCIEALAEICATNKVKKVGHSTDQDIEKMLKYFAKKFGVYKKIKLNSCNIDLDLFTMKPPQTLGLSDISYRYLGKYMRKKEKCVRTGNVTELTNKVQMEYVALDALMPLHMHEKFEHIIYSKASTSAILKNPNYEKKFFVDKGLKTLIRPFSDLGVDAIFLSGVSHLEIIQLCKRYQERILITHDKFLLACDDIPNKIPYFSPEQVFVQLNKINIEMFSSDSEPEDTDKQFRKKSK